MKTTKAIVYTFLTLILGNNINLAQAETDDTELEKKDSQVLSVVLGDWNQDEKLDTAILVKNKDEADLYLYLADEKEEQQLKLHKANVAWTGELAGTLPSLKKRGKQNSLVIQSANEAIGRSRWVTKLTVGYREDDFTVLGYTYESYDTLDTENSVECDVNLSTGKGFKNKKSFEIEPLKVSLKDWTEDNIPKQCSE